MTRPAHTDTQTHTHTHTHSEATREAMQFLRFEARKTRRNAISEEYEAENLSDRLAVVFQE